jgi:hypothetical protein
MNLPQPLEPRVIDDLPLRDLRVAFDAADEGDVPVDRVVAETLVLEVLHGAIVPRAPRSLNRR